MLNAAVMDHYNAIIAAVDAGFKQIEAKTHRLPPAVLGRQRQTEP
ncbi:MAG TPA: hypothetical protein VGJ20_42180 [Xanthobacteraceae bacterium]